MRLSACHQYQKDCRHDHISIPSSIMIIIIGAVIIVIIIIISLFKLKRNASFKTCLILSGPPNMVELSSSGGAGEGVGCYLGLFQLLPDDGEGGSQGPVYRQRHDGRQVYLYRWDKLLQAFVKLQLSGNCNWIKISHIITIQCSAYFDAH